MTLQSFRTRVLKDMGNRQFRVSYCAPIAKVSGVCVVTAFTAQKAHELCSHEVLKKLGWTGVWVGGHQDASTLVWVCSDDMNTPTACHKALVEKLYFGGGMP